VVYSALLWKINKKYRRLAALNDEYIQSLETLKNISTSEGLEKHFNELVRKWPRLKKISITSYRSCRESLSEL